VPPEPPGPETDAVLDMLLPPHPITAKEQTEITRMQASARKTRSRAKDLNAEKGVTFTTDAGNFGKGCPPDSLALRGQIQTCFV
jgi:hypothetical protein